MAQRPRFRTSYIPRVTRRVEEDSEDENESPNISSTTALHASHSIHKSNRQHESRQYASNGACPSNLPHSNTNKPIEGNTPTKVIDGTQTPMATFAIKTHELDSHNQEATAAKSVQHTQAKPVLVIQQKDLVDAADTVCGRAGTSIRSDKKCLSKALSTSAERKVNIHHSMLGKESFSKPNRLPLKTKNNVNIPHLKPKYEKFPSADTSSPKPKQDQRTKVGTPRAEQRQSLITYPLSSELVSRSFNDKTKTHQSSKKGGKAALGSSYRPKKGFLCLPGELRNQIYSYLIPSQRVLVCRTSPQKEHNHMKKCWSTVDQKPTDWSLHLYHLRQFGGTKIRRGMLFACQELHKEVESYLYSNIIFCFDSATNINLFLNIASKTGLKAIKSIEILQEGYGNPELNRDRIWQEKYNLKWEQTFHRVGQQLESLRSVYLETTLTNWPCNMSKGCIEPDLKASYLKLAPRGLDRAKVKVNHKMFDRNKWLLDDVARNLEDDMMTVDGRNRRDREITVIVEKQLQQKRDEKSRKAQAKLAESSSISPSQAKKAVVIRLQDVHADTSTSSSDRKFRSVGLEGYSRITHSDSFWSTPMPA